MPPELGSTFPRFSMMNQDLYHNGLAPRLIKNVMQRPQGALCTGHSWMGRAHPFLSPLTKKDLHHLLEASGLLSSERMSYSKSLVYSKSLAIKGQHFLNSMLRETRYI
ncbi:hypothetical protein AMTRI_Chr02g258710 [Amborella trichopoda]